MANTRSARKMVAKIAARTVVNTARRSRMRTCIRKVEAAIATGDRTRANEALRAAQPEIMRAASRGIIHKNASARKMARLSARIKSM